MKFLMEVGRLELHPIPYQPVSLTFEHELHVLLCLPNGQTVEIGNPLEWSEQCCLLRAYLRHSMSLSLRHLYTHIQLNLQRFQVALMCTYVLLIDQCYAMLVLLLIW